MGRSESGTPVPPRATTRAASTRSRRSDGGKKHDRGRQQVAADNRESARAAHHVANRHLRKICFWLSREIRGLKRDHRSPPMCRWHRLVSPAGAPRWNHGDIVVRPAAKARLISSGAFERP